MKLVIEKKSNALIVMIILSLSNDQLNFQFCHFVVPSREAPTYDWRVFFLKTNKQHWHCTSIALLLFQLRVFPYEISFACPRIIYERVEQRRSQVL